MLPVRCVKLTRAEFDSGYAGGGDAVSDLWVWLQYNESVTVSAKQSGYCSYVKRYTLLLSSPEFVCYCKFTGWLYIIWHQSVQFRDNKNEILSLVYIYVNL